MRPGTGSVIKRPTSSRGVAGAGASSRSAPSEDMWAGPGVVFPPSLSPGGCPRSSGDWKRTYLLLLADFSPVWGQPRHIVEGVERADHFQVTVNVCQLEASFPFSHRWRSRAHLPSCSPATCPGSVFKALQKIPLPGSLGTRESHTFLQPRSWT